MKNYCLVYKILANVFGCVLTFLLSACVLKNDMSTENDGKSYMTNRGLCHNINPGSQLHPVIFCEKQSALTLQVLNTKFSLDKRGLEKEIHLQLKSLVMATDIDPQYLSSAEIDVWISAPVLQPERAQLIVVVKGPAMGFAVFLPPDMKHWDFLSSSILQLGASGYPSMQTWKSGRFVMAADRSIRNGDWQSFEAELKASAGLTPAGLPRIKRAVYSGEGIVVETEQFSETFVASFLQQSKLGKKYKLRPVWIPASERDSYKAKGYSFKLAI